MLEPVRLTVASRVDAEHARRTARALAGDLGLDRSAAESVAIAVSELAMNLARYTPGGEIVLTTIEGADRRGIVVECQDAGPGIADLSFAMQDGFSTGGGLGSGLPAVRRLMDDFEISSSPRGTRVRATKWLTR